MILKSQDGFFILCDFIKKNFFAVVLFVIVFLCMMMKTWNLLKTRKKHFWHSVSIKDNDVGIIWGNCIHLNTFVSFPGDWITLFWGIELFLLRFLFITDFWVSIKYENLMEAHSFWELFEDFRIEEICFRVFFSNVNCQSIDFLLNKIIKFNSTMTRILGEERILEKTWFRMH